METHGVNNIDLIKYTFNGNNILHYSKFLSCSCPWPDRKFDYCQLSKIWNASGYFKCGWHTVWFYNYDFVTSRVDGVFSCDKELCAKYPKISYAVINAVPWVQDRKVHDKTKLVSMIASNKRMCQGHERRLHFVDKFRGKLDFYGRGFNEISCKEDGLRDYMFSVGIENAVYDTYFTEKLTDCFACGTIPIFYGCRGVTEYFNEDGIIFLDDNFDLSTLTKDLYYSKMDAIKDNFERSINFPVAEDYLYETYFK